MGIPWRKILGVGKTVGGLFLPGAVMAAVDQIEDHVITMKEGGKEGWSGAEKQQAALGAVLNGIIVAEGLTDRDILKDEDVAAAGRKAIDAVHASQVALAEFKEAVELFKASKVQAQE